MRLLRAIGMMGALVAALGAGAAAHAGPGGVLGNGAVYVGCSGGQLGITGQNPTGVEWVFEVGVWCPTSLSSAVIATGNWNPAVGGAVQGLGFGSLMISPLSCGSNSNVIVKTQMPAGPYIEAKASIARFCS